jgi:hypothetical protein
VAERISGKIIEFFINNRDMKIRGKSESFEIFSSALKTNKQIFNITSQILWEESTGSVENGGNIKKTMSSS